MGIEHMVLALGAIGAISGCVDDDRVVLENPGPRVEQQRDVGSFDEIEVAGPYRVVVSDGAPSALSISGPQAVLDHTEFQIEDGELSIRMEKGFRTKWSWDDENAVEITLSHNALKGAGIAGSGSIDIARSAVTEFEGGIAGSGNLMVRALEATRAEFAIAGSGDLSAAGKADKVEVSIAGSGNFDSPELEATDAEIEIAGSGDVATKVTGTADISIAGSGDVNVTGGAKCTISKAGSGDVVCS